MTDALNRRTFIKGAAGGAALLAGGGLPAWAKSSHKHKHKNQAIRQPDSLPFPNLPAGTPTMPEIRNIVVLIMENHSFDNLLGMVPHQVSGRAHVDGLRRHHHRIVNFNRDSTGHKVFATHAGSPCQLDGEPSQSWNASHESYDDGRNDGFVRASGAIAMAYWDRRDIPFTYSLAKHFPIGERYFCSVLAQTYPNRRFFFTTPAANGTIYDRLNQHGIDYGIYYQQVPSVLIVPNNGVVPTKLHNFSQFASDAAAGRLPAFTFIDPNYDNTSEENPQDIQVGEEFVAGVVETLMQAPTWEHTALFITYDEHGGYYDHVRPPRAIAPDSIPPKTTAGDYPGGYNRYGFRVPQIVVSPWARPHYVSRTVQDHTSMTAFIERKWNLPAMTFRDANAHPMTDYFNFRHAHFRQPPKLQGAPALGPGLAACHKQGLNPPLPSSGLLGSLPQSDVARYLVR